MDEPTPYMRARIALAKRRIHAAYEELFRLITDQGCDERSGMKADALFEANEKAFADLRKVVDGTMDPEAISAIADGIEETLGDMRVLSKMVIVHQKSPRFLWSPDSYQQLLDIFQDNLEEPD